MFRLLDWPWTLKNHRFNLKMLLGINGANISKDKKSGSQFTNMGEDLLSHTWSTLYCFRNEVRVAVSVSKWTVSAPQTSLPLFLLICTCRLRNWGSERGTKGTKPVSHAALIIIWCSYCRSCSFPLLSPSAGKRKYCFFEKQKKKRTFVF